MQKIIFTWEKGKGCTLEIDDIPFQRTAKSVIIETHGSGAPNVTLELVDGDVLTPKKENK